MADIILVPISEIQATVNKFNSQLSNLQEAFTALDNAKSHLDNCYKGPGYLVLSAKYAETVINCKTAERAINGAINGLQTTINEFTSAEESNTSKYQSIL